MKSEWGKLIKKKKEESMNAPGKCPICEKVFVKIEDYRNHVWPLHLEESGFQYTKSIPQQPMFQGRDLRQQKPRISRIRALFGATLNEAMEQKSDQEEENLKQMMWHQRVVTQINRNKKQAITRIAENVYYCRRIYI